MSFRSFIYNIRKKFPVEKLQRILFILLVILGIFVGFFVANIIVTFSDMKDIKPLETYSKYSVPTKVFDQKGRVITEFFYQKREIVSYKDLPDHLIKALMATEDNRFYKHHGFNVVALFKGLIINPLTGKRPRGGSTITQQLAKGLFTGGERTFFRKMTELWYAFQIEKKYSKEEILELYFNQFYFGHGCYGIQSAAKFYFDKDAKDLNLAESSLLAGIVQSPSRYSPIFNPYRMQNRHLVVLKRMEAMNYITTEEGDEAFESLWENYSTSFKNKSISANRVEDNPAPYFTEYIRQILLERYGEEKLYTGGLKIYTSLDLDKQVYAREELKKGIEEEQENYDKEFRSYSKRFRDENEDIVDMLSLTFGMENINIGEHKLKTRIEDMTKDYNDFIYLSSFMLGIDNVNKKIKRRYLLPKLVTQKKDMIEGALVSVNPKNGYIEAMVGGKEFTYANQFNRAVLAKRQMGSSFKPIYYSFAMENRIITPASLYDDKPIVYENDAGALWSPRNYDGTYRGPQRVRQALQYSINVVAVQVWDDIIKKLGYTKMMETLSKMYGLSESEMRERVQPQMAFALGVGVFSPLEVARAFSTFASDGKSVEPIGILRVYDRYDRIVDDFEIQREMNKKGDDQILSPATSFIMQDILNTVLYHGTGASAVAEAGFFYPGAGGKTGTTANWKDAWFCGFTKNLTTIVWIGFDDPNKSLGRHRAASSVAAPVWTKYMKKALQKDPPPPFSMSPGVAQYPVCFDTGKSPTVYCPHVLSEYFLYGTGPGGTCDKHTTDTPEIPDAIEIQPFSNINLKLENKLHDKDKDVVDENDLGDINLNLDLDNDF